MTQNYNNNQITEKYDKNSKNDNNDYNDRK